jgi:hypothetical protein
MTRILTLLLALSSNSARGGRADAASEMNV